jgi:hypothetical protein|tara:strand:- start:480 stop:1211 length:732 start_codon:yes stop_codon:yes gene_type:complete
MTLGLHETRSRRRRQARWAIIKNVLFLGSFGAVAWLSYETGYQLNLADTEGLRAQANQYQDTLNQLQIENAQLAGEITAKREETDEWQRRYERDVPKGVKAELLSLMDSKLSDGLPLERLQFVINTVEPQRSCSAETTTKRFLVRTPLYKGANPVVDFGQGAISVSGRGISSRNENGDPLAWYDAKESVTLDIAQIGGESATVEGVLPLHFSLVRGAKEHRFAARADERRGFMVITEDTCAYP